MNDKILVEGKECRRIRNSLKISQKEVAESIGISRHSLSNYEYGNIDMPLTVSLRLNQYYRRKSKEMRNSIDKTGGQ